MMNPTTHSPWNAFRRKYFWRVGIGLLMIGLLVSGWLWHSACDRVQAKLNALRAKGLPTTVQEINAFYTIPAGATDRTREWVTAIDALLLASAQLSTASVPVVGLNSNPIPQPGTPWAEFEVSRQVIRDLDAELQLIRAAASVPGQVRFPIDCSLGPVALLTHIQRVRHVARIMVLDAYVSAHEGQHSRILQNIRTISALSEATRAEPFLIPYYVGTAINSVALGEIEKWISYCGWSDAELVSLQMLILSPRFEEEIVRSLAGDQAFGLTELDKMVLGPFRQSVQLEYLRLIDDGMNSFSYPWPEPLIRQAAITARLNALKSEPLSLLKYSQVPSYGPAVEQAGRTVARSVAKQRCCVLLIAAQRYRLQTGQLPVSLKEIENSKLWPSTVPQDLFVDPFDGQPLRFKADATGMVIYSVSQNRADDGGEIPSTSSQVRDNGFKLLRNKMVHDLEVKE